MAFQYPSILIPHVWGNISSDYIASIITKQLFGTVGRIDMIPRDNSNGKESNMVFIHMNEWYQNTAAQNLRNRIMRGHEGRIVYDDPWHWIVVKARNPRVDGVLNQIDRKISNKKPRMMDQRVHQLHEGIDQFVNQTQAQGDIIHSLNMDLVRANNYIKTLENKISFKEQLSSNNTERSHYTSDEQLFKKSIQWASKPYLLKEIPIDIITIREGEQVSETNSLHPHSEMLYFIENNMSCKNYQKMDSYYLYNNFILPFANHLKEACLEYTKQRYQKKTIDVSVSPNIPAAKSPSQLPTPSMGKHIDNNSNESVTTKKLTVETDFSENHNDMNHSVKCDDFDCGDVSEMARRSVSDEIKSIRKEREQNGVKLIVM